MHETLQTITGRHEVDIHHVIPRQDGLIWLVVFDRTHDGDEIWQTYLCAARQWSQGRKHTRGYEHLGFRDAGKCWHSESAALAYAQSL